MIACFGGGEGFKSSINGGFSNPGLSDQAVMTNEFRPALKETAGHTGCRWWELGADVLHRLHPNADQVDRIHDYAAQWCWVNYDAFTATTRVVIENARGWRLAFSGSGTSGNLNLYNPSWNLLLTGPAFSLGGGTWAVAGYEVNNATGQVRIWFNQTNNGWQTIPTNLNDLRQDFYYRNRVQTAGKQGNVFRLDDFVLLDGSGSKNNQWPSTYPRVTNIQPVNYVSGPTCALPAAGFDNGTYKLWTFQPITAVSDCTPKIDLSAETINAVIVHAGYENCFTNDGLYAARDTATGIFYDGPATGRFNRPVGGNSQRTWLLDSHPDGSPWTPTKLGNMEWGFKYPLPAIATHYVVKVLYGGVGMDAPPPPAISAIAPPIGMQVI